MLRQAFTMKVEVAGDEAVVQVRNSGAGRNFPGERHFRMLLLRIDVLDSKTHPVEEYRTVLKNVTPLRMARLDADIKAGKGVSRHYGLPVAAGSVRVRLLYKLYPHVQDSEAIVLAEEERRFPE